MNELERTIFETAAISVFTPIKADKAVKSLIKILKICAAGDKAVNPEAIDEYSKIPQNTEFEPFSMYLRKILIENENILSKKCSRNEIIPEMLLKTGEKDLSTVKNLIKSVSVLRERLFAEAEEFGEILPAFEIGCENDVPDLESLIKIYTKFGAGEFAKNKFFKISSDGELKPVANPDSVRLCDLKAYEIQKEEALKNFKAFLGEKPYNNVLLYGDRGTGKSSCVKALANEFENVRIIRVEKDKLQHLGEITEKIEQSPFKFIIFLDDMTFDVADDRYNALKATLEGALGVLPKNAVIYATSNRRHIVKETFGDRTGDEVHVNDTIDELMSLSDRFGLTITYTRPDKSDFLRIIEEIAKDKNIELPENYAILAERFAIKKGSRSPRVANQFLEGLFS